MFKYAAKRILRSLVILVVTLFAVFALLNYIPGSRLKYISIMGQGDLLDSLFSALNAESNLFTRYLRYLYNIITRFEFLSGFRHHSLSTEIIERSRLTLLLTICALILVVLVGIPLGVFSARKKGSLPDRAISVFSMTLASIPPFCLAIFLAMVFCVGLRLLPVFGYKSPINFILPTITIASAAVAETVQITRFSVIEEMKKPYITSLRSRGQSENVIVYRHALRNALLPVCSVIKENMATVFVSTFIAEWFYAIPGIGYNLIQSIVNRDYGVVMASTMVIAIFIIVINIIGDVLMYLIDPKLRTAVSGGSANE